MGRRSLLASSHRRPSRLDSEEGREKSGKERVEEGGRRGGRRGGEGSMGRGGYVGSVQRGRVEKR